jgi:hypothetical protein
MIFAGVGKWMWIMQIVMEDDLLSFQNDMAKQQLELKFDDGG